MNVLVAGGAGSSGRVVGAILAKAESIESVTLVDRVGGSEGISGSEGFELADVADREVLAGLIDRYSVDLVVNAAGPYRETLAPVLETAIMAGIGYVDMAEGLRETEAAMAFSGRAEIGGSVCWIGMGTYPGLTNLLARIAADRLDRVDSIAVALVMKASAVVPDLSSVSQMRASGRIRASWQSLLEAAAPPVGAYRDGEIVDVHTSGASTLLAPSGDRVTLRAHNHAEALTLPISYPTVDRVTTFLGFTPDRADELFRMQVGRAATGMTTPVDAMVTFMEDIDERRNDLESDMPSTQMWASATGTLEGRRTSVETWASGVWATSPRVLAETAIAVCDGRFSTPGFHTPEHVAEIHDFPYSIARRAGMSDEPLINHRTTTL